MLSQLRKRAVLQLHQNMLRHAVKYRILLPATKYILAVLSFSERLTMCTRQTATMERGGRKRLRDLNKLRAWEREKHEKIHMSIGFMVTARKLH